MNKKPKTSKTSPLDAPLYDADSIERMTFHCGSGWDDLKVVIDFVIGWLYVLTYHETVEGRDLTYQWTFPLVGTLRETVDAIVNDSVITRWKTGEYPIDRIVDDGFKWDIEVRTGDSEYLYSGEYVMPDGYMGMYDKIRLLVLELFDGIEFKPDEVEGAYVSIRKEKSSENYSIDEDEMWIDAKGHSEHRDTPPGCMDGIRDILRDYPLTPHGADDRRGRPDSDLLEFELNGPYGRSFLIWWGGSHPKWTDTMTERLMGAIKSAADDPAARLNSTPKRYEKYVNEPKIESITPETKSVSREVMDGLGMSLPLSGEDYDAILQRIGDLIFEDERKLAISMEADMERYSRMNKAYRELDLFFTRELKLDLLNGLLY